MSGEHEAAFKQGYNAAEKFYQAQVEALTAENAQLNRSKNVAKSLIKKLTSKIVGGVYG